jgi:hypothetical protein
VIAEDFDLSSNEEEDPEFGDRFKRKRRHAVPTAGEQCVLSNFRNLVVFLCESSQEQRH